VRRVYLRKDGANGWRRKRMAAQTDGGANGWRCKRMAVQADGGGSRDGSRDGIEIEIEMLCARAGGWWSEMRMVESDAAGKQPAWAVRPTMSWCVWCGATTWRWAQRAFGICARGGRQRGARRRWAFLARLICCVVGERWPRCVRRAWRSSGCATPVNLGVMCPQLLPYSVQVRDGVWRCACGVRATWMVRCRLGACTCA